MAYGSLSRRSHTKTQSEDKHVESRLIPCLDRGSTPRISTTRGERIKRRGEERNAEERKRISDVA